MRRVLLDTNTLLLWLVGSVAPERIGGKRLERFDLFDFDRLTSMLKARSRHVSLPNILTEVSNLIGAGRQNWGERVLMAFEGYCAFVEEVYEPSVDLAKMHDFRALGLTDTAILRLSQDKVKVFTVDFALGNRLASSGVEVVNLMHFKTPR